VATLWPPVALALTPAEGPPVAVLAAGPPVPDTDEAVPPLPPLPPTTAELVTLAAPPVSPDWAVALDEAPELAELVALPSATAAPVSPLGAAVVGVVVAGGPTGLDVVVVGAVVVVWATAAPQNTRMAATRAPTVADTLEIILAEPGLPVFMLIPCRWVDDDPASDQKSWRPLRLPYG